MIRVNLPTKILTIIPLAAGTVSTILFLAQGGFGGGHSGFDFVITTLGFPSIMLLLFIAFPDAAIVPDIMLVVWIPALLNSFLFFLLGLTITKLIALRKG